jgi:hypothetical protein
MNCQTAINYLEDYLDGLLDDASRSSVQGHLEKCPDCRNRLAQEQDLRQELKALPVPSPDPDFAARVFKHAAARKYHRRIYPSAMMRMAACILVFIALGFVFKGLWGPGHPKGLEVSVVMNEPEEVRLVFYSSENLRGVTFTLELPSGVELLGYEEQRKIVWQGALDQGSNLLVLPVIVRNPEGGSLIAGVSHGKRNKKFGLFLNVQQPGDPRTSSDRFEGSILTNKLI